MSERLKIFILGILLLAAAVVWWPVVTTAGPTGQYLTVRFLDIGQGDAIHIETPDGYEMLVDGGPSAVVLRPLAKGRSLFDHSIDVVIATHPDTDHIAGLSDVLARYDVGLIIESGAKGASAAAAAFTAAAAAAAADGAKLVDAQAGQRIQLGASTTVRILSPRGDTTNWETNTASVVVQVVYGDVEFMLTGDAPQAIENYLVGTYGAGLESEVLKLGHHGSDNSSSELFLKTVHPEYAVVSAGQGNRYEHPKPVVIRRASEAGAQIISTIDNGTITFQSDGKRVWVKGGGK